MKHLHYSGILYQNDRFADNREEHSRCIKRLQAGEFLGAGFTIEWFKRNIEFLNRFPPEVPHDRLVAHIIEVYQINEPKWTKSGRELVVPTGELECLATIDLGRELLRMAGGESFVEEVIKENVTHKLPDGTFVRGTHFKKVLPADSDLELAQKYFNVKCYLGVCADNLVNYEFGFNPTTPTSKPQLEFKVTSYVKIDGQLVKEEKEIARAHFWWENTRNGYGPQPGVVHPYGFKGWRYSKN